MPSSPDTAARRTPAFGSFLEGWRRVLNAPALAAGVLLVTFLCALPLALVMKDAMARHLGASVEAEAALSAMAAALDAVGRAATTSP